ncbi:MAG: hypothetical protein B7X41_11820, partial [Microbacterium sp. 14-71-5]
ALGVALLGGLLVSTLASSTRANLGTAGLPPAAVDGLTTAVKDSAGIAIAGLKTAPGMHAAATAAADAMVHASQVTTGLAAIALAVGLAATFALPRRSATPRPTAPALAGHEAPDVV